MEWEWIKDDNRNGTCAYLFCLVEQGVIQIVKGAFVYPGLEPGIVPVYQNYLN